MVKKTFKNASKLLTPLYKEGKPFIISEKDYMWVREVIPPNGYGVVRFMGENVFFDTLKTKQKTKKLPCRWCKKTNGVIKFYIIADDLESPKAYHPACMRKLEMEVIMKLSDTKLQINGKKII